MIFDRMLSFFENESYTSGTKTSRPVYLRLNGGEIVGDLNVLIVANKTPDKTITTTLTNEVGDEIVSQTSVGNVLFKGKLPKEAIGAVYASVAAASALASAITIKGGVVCGELETDKFPTLQSLAITEAKPHIEDALTKYEKREGGKPVVW